MIFFHSKFFYANSWGRKGGTFMVGPGRHLASLRHYLTPLNKFTTSFGAVCRTDVQMTCIPHADRKQK